MNYRHGDIALKARKSQFEGPAAFVGKEFVLAVGEATGHAHRVLGDIEVFGYGGTPVGLKVKGEGAKIEHQEHGTIELEAGTYDVAQEREQDTERRHAYTMAD